MALWKPFRGNRASLETVAKHDGYVYFCTDDGSLHFDYTDADGNLQRKQISAKDAETLCGMSLEELKEYVSTQDAVALGEAKAYTDTKIAEIDIPTKVSELENDAGYLTEVPSEYVTETELNDAIANIPTGGGGSSVAIADVETLPTENINGEVFYRLTETIEVAPEYYEISNGKRDTFNGLPLTLNVVETLPEVGDPAYDNLQSPTKVTAYFRVSDNTLHNYLNDDLASYLGVPTGWYEASVLDYPYAVVNSEADATDPDLIYIVVIEGYTYPRYSMYYYADGWVKVGASIKDVTELPAQGIDEGAFYRVKEELACGYDVIVNGEKNGTTDPDTGEFMPINLYTVATLPEVGAPYIDVDALINTGKTEMNGYFQMSDSTLYVYIDETMSDLPAGWYSADFGGIPYAIVSSPEEATEPEVFYLVPGESSYVHTLYTNNDGEWQAVAPIRDVTSLPVLGMNDGYIYRLAETVEGGLGSVLYAGVEDDGTVVTTPSFGVLMGDPSIPAVTHVVSELPATGLPFIVLNSSGNGISGMNMYFNTADMTCMGYMDDLCSMVFSVPVGWYDVGVLMEAQYTVVSSKSEVVDSQMLYVIYTPGTTTAYTLYHHNDNGWEKLGAGGTDDLSIPTKVSELENDAGYLIGGHIVLDYSSATVEEVTNAINAFKEGRRVFVKVAGEAYLPEVQSILSSNSELLVAQYYSRASTFETQGDITFNEIQIGVYYSSIMKSHTKSQLANVFATKIALNSKQDVVSFDGAYDANTNKVATVQTVTDAIANIDIPTKVSELTEDETHRTVSDTEKATWNAKSDFSGSYNDLTDKPNHSSNYITLVDQINGYEYAVQMIGGNLVSFCKCTSIEVTTPPTKTGYFEGDTIDVSGLELTAICQDGSSRRIENYTYSPTIATSDTKYLNVTYEECGTAYTATIALTHMLVDFEYIANDDGTYTITSWKGTLNGVASTELIVPDSDKIII